MKAAEIERKYYLLFFAALLALSIHFKYHEVLFYLPQSTDIWRQSDCASFAYNYYQHGMHFFEPEVHNMLSGTGKAVGECPIIYYCVAALYKVFGPHIFIFRLFNLLIFYLGVTALFRLTYRLTSDLFFAFVTPLLFFASPIILFYANNFLSDVPSLSFVFLALDRLLLYKESGRLKDFWICMLFFTLAGLLKANSVIVLIAAGTMFFIEWNQWEGKNTIKVFRHNMINALGFFFSLLAIFLWYRWAIHYNAVNHSVFLGTQSWPGWPLWEVSDGNLVSSFTMFFQNLNHLFTLPLSLLFFFLVPYVLFNLNKLPYALKGLFLLVFIGSLVFYCFFFVGFKEQGYYYINLMILPVLAFIGGALVVKQHLPNVFASLAFRGLVFILLLVTVYNGKASTRVFYHNGWKHAQMSNDLYDPGLQSYMDSIGITSTEIVLSIPDETPDASLYLLNRKGWSNYGFEDGKIDVAGIENRIREGCRYLVINDEKVFQGDNILLPYLMKPLGKFRNIQFFKIKSCAEPHRIKTANRYLTMNNIRQLTLSNSPYNFYLTRLVGNEFSISAPDWFYVSTFEDPEMPVLANEKRIGPKEKFFMEMKDSTHFVFRGKEKGYIGMRGELFYTVAEKEKAALFSLE